MFCDDIINEILLYLDSKTISSWLSTNKYMSIQFSSNTMIKQRKILGRELRCTEVKKRKYYKCNILKFVIGDRITDKIHNYKVIEIYTKYAILNVVDLYGNVIDNEVVYTSIHNFKNNKNKNNLAWATWHKYDNTVIQIKLIYGIIKHTCGPTINHVDSKYLNYITKEQHILIPHIVGQPELNMFITVNYKMNIYEYVIVHITTNFITMMYIDITDINDKNKLQMKLNANKLNDKWIIDNYKYKIITFGGFKYI